MERRGGTRVATNLPSRAYLDGTTREYELIDLSTRGALIRRGGRRAPPLVHEMAFELDDREVSARVRTVWVNEQLHAVRFVEMCDVDRLEIAEWIDSEYLH